jgi:AraC-like DNA-binding protein
MEIQPTNVVHFVFIFQAIFGVFLIWHNARYRGLCYILIFASCAMAFNLFEEIANTKDFYLITPIFILGQGPLFYLFVYQLIYVKKIPRNTYLVHLLPMLIALPFTPWVEVIIVLGTISQLIYAYLLIKLILAYHHASFSIRSDADSLQLFWLVKVVVLLILVGIFDLIRLNIQPYISIELNVAGQFIENASVLFLFSLLIYKAVQQPKLFNGMGEFEQLNKIDSNTTATNVDDVVHSIFVNIDQIIKDKLLHHKPRLSLHDIATETGLNTRDISRAINQSANGSFCDYINKLRVDNLKDKLLINMGDKVSIIDLAFDVGFNSKSSLNSIFKRETGLTPTQFLKNNEVEK